MKFVEGLEPKQMPVELRKLVKQAKKVAENKRVRTEVFDFLYKHTVTEDQHYAILDAIDKLARLDSKLGEWKKED